MENTPVIVPVSKLKTHFISAALTFLSVFIPVFAFSVNSGVSNTTLFTWDFAISLIITGVRTAGKAAIQALFLEEITFWKKEVDTAKAEGQTTTELPQ